MVRELNEKYRAYITTATLLDSCTDAAEYEMLHGKLLAMQQEFDPFEYEYEEISDALQCEQLVYSEHEKYGIRASFWTPAVEPTFDGIESMNYPNVFKVERDGKVGIIWLDEEVHELFKVEYDSILEFAQNQYIVVKDSKQYYSRGGRVSASCFDEIRIPRCAGWIHVKKDGVWGHLDGNLEFCSCESAAHEYVIPCKRIGWSYVVGPPLDYRPVTRQEIMECDRKEHALKDLNHNHEEWRACERQAQALIPNPECQVIAQDGKYGVADFLGHAIFPPVYDEIVISDEAFPQIYAQKQGLWAQLIPSDEPTSPIFVSEELPKTCLYENWAVAKVKGKYGVYNPFNGKWLLEPVYDNLQVEKTHQCVITQQGSLYGFFNSEFCIRPSYKTILLGSPNTFVRALKNGAVGYFDETGQWTTDIAHARVYTGF